MPASASSRFRISRPYSRSGQRMARTARPRPPLRTCVSHPLRSPAGALASFRFMHDTLHIYVSCVNRSCRRQEARMAAIEDRTESRARVISAAEVACAAWAVIGHNVLHVLPNEVPILVLLALVSMRWREGGWAA